MAKSNTAKNKGKNKEDLDYITLCGNIKELLKTRQGKDFIWYILSISNLYGDNFTGNSHTFYLEGKRSVGLEILQLLEDVDPTAYATLLLDHQKTKEN